MANNLLFSNSIDTLIDRLKTSLFSKQTFLSTQVVVVPNSEFENKIRYAFCNDRDLQGIFGVQFLLKEQLSSLLSSFYKEDKTSSRLEVSLFIEKILDSLLESHRDDPLLSIIRKDPLSRKSKIAEELSEIFMKYALFQPKFFDGNFSLLQEIFSKVNKEMPFLQITENSPRVQKKTQLHFFCLRYLPPKYLDLFSKTSANIIHYIFSPTEHYWEDFVSDHEEKRILKKALGDKKIVKQALQDKHPLLANLGVLKREYLKTLSNYDFPIEERYFEKEPKNLLEHLQADIFHLNSEKTTLTKDDSITVYHATSKLDEVLQVKAAIEKSDAELDQVAIYVPDLISYLPFFEMVFGQNIKVIGKHKSSNLLSGIYDLFSIFENGLNAKRFQKLLFNQCIQQSFNLSKQDVYRITRWVENVFISDQWDTEKFNRIVLGLVIHVDKELHNENYPLLGLENGDCDLVDRLVSIVTKLQEDLLFVKDIHHLDSWLFWLSEIENRYFFKESGSFLKSVCQSFEIDTFLNTPYLFDSILSRLYPMLDKKKTSTSTNFVKLPTLSCLKNNVACSYEQTYVLGLNDSVFSYRKDPLDPMEYKCYTPCQKDQDTAFFLEVVMFTSKKLFFSYQKGSNPALMLHQLLNYIDQIYSIDQESLLFNISKPFVEKELFGLDQQQSSEKQINTIRIEDLNALTTHPVRFFVQKVLRSDLDKSYLGNVNLTKEYSFDAMNRAFFRHDVLINGYVKAFSSWQKADLFPSLFFLKSINDDLEEEGRKIDLFLKKFSLRREAFEKRTLDLKLDDVEVHGRFLVHDKGFILKENNLDQLVKFWPSILGLCLLENKDRVELFFLKEEESKVFVIEDVIDEFSLLVEYYKAALKSPSPLIRMLIKPLLYEDEKAFQKKIDQSSMLSFSDPYFNLIFEKNGAADLFAKWHPIARKTFSSLMKNFEGLYEVV